jgi:hypothetical protein
VQHLKGYSTGRKHDEIHGSEHFSAHGIDVAESVCSCDLSEIKGVRADRREKVRCLDQGNLIGRSSRMVLI